MKLFTSHDWVHFNLSTFNISRPTLLQPRSHSIKPICVWAPMSSISISAIHNTAPSTSSRARLMSLGSAQIISLKASPCQRPFSSQHLLPQGPKSREFAVRFKRGALSALAQQVREDGLLHTTCGTPNYVAPEVINNKGYDGAKADLWSCGVILFVLMAGHLPFQDTNLMSLYMKIFKVEFTCPSWFSTRAKKLIKRILDPRTQRSEEPRRSHLAACPSLLLPEVGPRFFKAG